MDMENYAGSIADVIANNTNAEEIENVYPKQNHGIKIEMILMDCF